MSIPNIARVQYLCKDCVLGIKYLCIEYPYTLAPVTFGFGVSISSPDMLVLLDPRKLALGHQAISWIWDGAPKLCL